MSQNTKQDIGFLSIEAFFEQIFIEIDLLKISKLGSIFQNDY